VDTTPELLKQHIFPQTTKAPLLILSILLKLSHLSAKWSFEMISLYRDYPFLRRRVKPLIWEVGMSLTGGRSSISEEKCKSVCEFVNQIS
jgi:hypothetical protein